MNKENYVKPVLDVLELSDDVVLASGCEGHGCGYYSGKPTCPSNCVSDDTDCAFY